MLLTVSISKARMLLVSPRSQQMIYALDYGRHSIAASEPARLVELWTYKSAHKEYNVNGLYLSLQSEVISYIRSSHLMAAG